MNWIGYIVGALMVLTGIVWILQGVGILPGSFMTGQPEWAVAGVISAIVGGVVIWLVYRRGASPEERT